MSAGVATHDCAARGESWHPVPCWVPWRRRSLLHDGAHDARRKRSAASPRHPVCSWATAVAHVKIHLLIKHTKRAGLLLFRSARPAWGKKGSEATGRGGRPTPCRTSRRLVKRLPRRGALKRQTARRTRGLPPPRADGHAAGALSSRILQGPAGAPNQPHLDRPARDHPGHSNTHTLPPLRVCGSPPGRLRTRQSAVSHHDPNNPSV